MEEKESEIVFRSNWEISDSVLISALQKFIRRCKVREAMAVAERLCIKAEGSTSATFCLQSWFRLKRRLVLVATEDIGVAHCGVLHYIEKELSGLEQRDTSTIISTTLSLVKALASANKSRLTDHAFIYLKDTFEKGEWNIRDGETIWDITVNEDINEDRLLKHLVWNWLNRGNKGDVYGCWNALLSLSLRLPEGTNEEMNDIYLEWQKNDCVLFLLHAGLLVTRGLGQGFPLVQIAPVNDNYNENNGNGDPKEIIIPDYVYDMHTAKGREMGRNLTHFIMWGCQISNRTQYDRYYELLFDRFCS